MASDQRRIELGMLLKKKQKVETETHQVTQKNKNKNKQTNKKNKKKNEADMARASRREAFKNSDMEIETNGEVGQSTRADTERNTKTPAASIVQDCKCAG